MLKRAAIDIGSNSILLLIATLDGSKLDILENESNVTGLGKDLDKNGAFLDSSMEESLSVLKNYADKCSFHNISLQDVIVTATEAARVASNSASFIERVKDHTGLNIKLISGEGEAYYSTMGILFDSKITDDQITIMDIGGASTELIRVEVKSKKILHSFSMPVGAVRMNNWKEEGHFQEKLNDIFKNFNQDLLKVICENLYCVAGTMTSVGNIYLGHKDFLEQEVNGLSFKFSELSELASVHEKYSKDEMLSKYPFLGKRAATIHSGIQLALAIMSRIGNTDIYISTYGLRYGTLLSGGVSNEFTIH